MEALEMRISVDKRLIDIQDNPKEFVREEARNLVDKMVEEAHLPGAERAR